MFHLLLVLSLITIWYRTSFGGGGSPPPPPTPTHPWNVHPTLRETTSPIFGGQIHVAFRSSRYCWGGGVCHARGTQNIFFAQSKTQMLWWAVVLRVTFSLWTCFKFSQKLGHRKVVRRKGGQLHTELEMHTSLPPMQATASSSTWLQTCRLQQPALVCFRLAGCSNQLWFAADLQAAAASSSLLQTCRLQQPALVCSRLAGYTNQL